MGRERFGGFSGANECARENESLRSDGKLEVRLGQGREGEENPRGERGFRSGHGAPLCLSLSAVRKKENEKKRKRGKGPRWSRPPVGPLVLSLS